MKLYIFGSCSGTEPFQNRHHTSFALESHGRIYWFEAGESCSHTAYLMGIDMMSVSDIFISHSHIDHVGGLPNLLWTIAKLYSRTQEVPHFGDITIHMPNQQCFDSMMMFFQNTSKKYVGPYQTPFHRITDGILLDTENIRISALHNTHVKKTDAGWQSFSFCIEAEDKKIVYSGDVKSTSELEELLDGGCDLLLMETGHHSPEKICEEMRNKSVKNLYFLHHGRAILTDYDGVLRKCREIFPNVVFCNDKDIFEVV